MSIRKLLVNTWRWNRRESLPSNQRKPPMSKKHKVLMLVENMAVPADPRVWHEAYTLHHLGYHVSIICPKGQSRNKETYICIDGIHIYRYDLPDSANKSSDYIREFAIAM